MPTFEVEVTPVPSEAEGIAGALVAGAGIRIGRGVQWIATGLPARARRSTLAGIETQEQMERVREAGCTEGQGYLFSRPRPLSEFNDQHPVIPRAMQAA